MCSVVNVVREKDICQEGKGDALLPTSALTKILSLGGSVINHCVEGSGGMLLKKNLGFRSSEIISGAKLSSRIMPTNVFLTNFSGSLQKFCGGGGKLLLHLLHKIEA